MIRGNIRSVALWLSVCGVALVSTTSARAQTTAPSSPASAAPAVAAPTTKPAAVGSSAGAASTGAASSGGAASPAIKPPIVSKLTPPPPSPYKPLGVRDVLPEDIGPGISPGVRTATQSNFYPVPDRWRVGLPGDYIQNTKNDTLFDPYGQNVLKGDYPILDQDKFLILTLTSDTLFEARNLPSAGGISAARPDSQQFFGRGDQQLLQEQFVESVDFFKGDAEYRPRDFDIRETGVFSFDNLHTSEQGQVNPDVRDRTTRNASFFGFQELFAEYKIADVSPNYDILSVRVGIQSFNNDFRGFLFNDEEPGIRIFGNLESNRIQYNLAFFSMLEKDTNTGLNTFNSRNQSVFLANLFYQDFLTPGYTAQVSLAANYDNPELRFDRNGNIARPEPIGTVAEKAVRAYYIGWAGDGRIGRFNVSHQFYQALGEESFNNIAGRKTQINAQLGAIELSYDSDYIRYRASFTYASGDGNPTDNKATGFDSIFDNPNFFGGGMDLFTRQSIAFLNTKVNLTQRNSFLPNLRTSKEEGQANFVNPGLFVYNAGVDFDVTQEFKIVTNISFLQFADMSSLQLSEHDNRLVDRDIGLDYSVGFIYRPLLNNNVIVTVGLSALTPFGGFKKIYTSETLYSTFIALTLTY